MSSRPPRETELPLSRGIEPVPDRREIAVPGDRVRERRAAIAMQPAARIAVVIPCYKVARHIEAVLAAIGPECWRIYVVDDACPEHTGDFVARNVSDERIRILRHEVNKGVGGAVITGYRAAADDGATVIVKIDGDGQMDPRLIGRFVAPILAGEADYTKGNRFYDLEHISRMPRVRIFGNAALSILAKLSTGYWGVFDPTNGYTAMHARLVRLVTLEKISERYFFETDLLFRLNTVRAVVLDIPMDAKYEDESSNLRVRHVVGEFLFKHLRNFGKRIFYNYFLRNMSIASLQLLSGILLLTFGLAFGGYHWLESMRTGVPNTAGTVMIAALSVLAGIQFGLSFMSYDMASTPQRPIHPLLGDPALGRGSGQEL
jgi:glycosyltransferase involved in cell wall biosynthesis